MQQNFFAIVLKHEFFQIPFITFFGNKGYFVKNYLTFTNQIWNLNYEEFKWNDCKK